MRNENQMKRWRQAAVFGVLVAVLLFPSRSVQAAQVNVDAVVSAAAQILYHNEGSYNSVNANDNGAVSIGKLQWHGWRALSLLQTIVQANETQAQELLGDTLYAEVVSTKDTTKWSTRKLSAKEAAAVKNLLATDESKAAQDVLAVTDITDYINQGLRLGITNEPALVYFADLANQGGSGASGRVAASASRYAGSYEAVTLNELHEAAICDSVMGAYTSRRFETYKYAAGLGWSYCGASDSYIPYDYVSARDLGTAWVQRALNTCMNAQLAVTNTYDDATKASVTAYQAANKLEVDGYAGKDTIVALIKAVFKGTTVQDPGTSVPQPDIPQNPSVTDPNITIKDPNTDTQEPGLTEPDPLPPVQEPEEPVKKTLEETVLESSKASYAVNDTSKGFQLEVTSSHTEEPLTYRSSESAVLTVDSTGMVKITGAGSAQVVVKQRETDTYAAAELTIPVTVYSTDPADYPKPTGALYAEKKMKKQHVQWLQATLISLDGADVTVDGGWTKAMTKLVTAFQKKCGITADGIVGDQTQDLLRQMLFVKAKKPETTIQCSAKGNTISWKKYIRANRVYIYRKEKGGAYKRIKTITNMQKTSYQDTSAKSGATYYYVIKYALQQNKVLVKSQSSKGVTGIRR
ncbi:MAG: peptidoglycan-binding protein [Eubacterium sp.]|nr:peptidoglycan-binding protein [Eubacterium sp.]